MKNVSHVDGLREKLSRLQRKCDTIIADRSIQDEKLREVAREMKKINNKENKNE